MNSLWVLNIVHRKSQVSTYGIHRLCKTWLYKPVKHRGYKSSINSGKQDNASLNLGTTVSLLKIEDYLKKTNNPSCRNNLPKPIQASEQAGARGPFVDAALTLLLE